MFRLLRNLIGLWALVMLIAFVVGLFDSEPMTEREKRIHSQAKRTCNMMKARTGADFSDARCRVEVKGRIASVVKTQGLTENCAAIQVHHVFRYMLDGVPEGTAKILAGEHMPQHC